METRQKDTSKGMDAQYNNEVIMRVALIFNSKFVIYIDCLNSFSYDRIDIIFFIIKISPVVDEVMTVTYREEGCDVPAVARTWPLLPLDPVCGL
jgi:hypothetical protein